MEIQIMRSPRLLDCGHWSSDKYYWEEKKTGKKICCDCFKEGNLKEASRVNQVMSGKIFNKR